MMLKKVSESKWVEMGNASDHFFLHLIQSHEMLSVYAGLDGCIIELRFFSIFFLTHSHRMTPFDTPGKQTF